MKLKICYALILVGLCGAASSSQAVIIDATSLNLQSVFATVASGDTIRLTGNFDSQNLANRSFTSLVTIDATQAKFTDSLSISNVANLKISNGTFGSATMGTRTSRAIGIFNSSNITLQKNTFIGNGAAMGVTMQNVSQSSIISGTFTDFKLGFGVASSSDIKISSNRFNRMTSDGINIVDSHRVAASANTCSGTIPGDGFHPDCIQLWSIAGNAVQSDISISKNIATGATQGFTSFNPEDGGGLRISMVSNTVSTSFPQGIACYNCVSSKFTGNVLTTLPGARWQTSMNIVGGGKNTISNNSIGALPVANLTALSVSSLADPDGSAGTTLINPNGWIDDALPDFVNDDFARLAANDPGAIDNPADPTDPKAPVVNPLRSAQAFGFESIAAVPETAVWMQIILGFGLIGAVSRKRGGVDKFTHP